MGRSERLVPGAGGLAVGSHPPGDEGAGHGADGGVDNPGGRLGNPLTHRQVEAAEVRGVQGVFQRLLGVRVLGDHQQAAGPLVQPVDRMKIGLNTLLIVIIQQKITDCIGKVAGARMDGYAGELVEDQDIGVLIHDVQRSGGWDNAAAAHAVCHQDGEDLASAGADVGMDPDAVQQNPVAQPLHPADYRAREAQAGAHEGIDLPARLLRCDGEGQAAGRRGAHSFLL